MPVVIVDEGYPQVLNRDVDFLLELLQLFSLASFGDHCHVFGKKQDALSPVEERHPVDLSQTVICKLATLVL